MGEHEKEQDTSALDTLAASKRGIVKCRICKEDHWTTQCPYKDTLGPLRESLTGPVDEADAAPGAAPAAAAPAPGGDMMPDRRREDTAAIRVSNLSENAQETDLQ